MPATAAGSPPAPGGAVRAAIALLSLAGFFSGVGLRICDGLIPRIASDFGIGAGTAGQVMLTYSIAYGLSQLAFGPAPLLLGPAIALPLAGWGFARGLKRRG